MAQATAPLKKELQWIEVGEGNEKERVVEGSKEHKALLQEFDAGKKYMFELAVEAPVRHYPVIDMRTQRPVPHKKFKPLHNMVMTSQIVWNGQRRIIRYYDGCTSLFTDKQPKEKELIEQLILQSSPKKFIDGKIGFYGDERMLLIYAYMCSWNVDSPFRTRTADGIFRSVDTGAMADSKAAKIDMIELALKYAKEASETKMRIHADFLGISSTDWDSGNEKVEKEIRAEYKEKAMDDPYHFVESYGNKAIEVKYYIDKALLDKTIDSVYNPNKATWGSSHSEIVDISGLRSHEAISQRLFEYSQSEEGADFLVQLKALYKE